MSRTYRKNFYNRGRNSKGRESFISDSISNDFLRACRRGYELVRKDKKEYKEEKEKADSKYKEELIIYEQMKKSVREYVQEHYKHLSELEKTQYFRIRMYYIEKYRPVYKYVSKNEEVPFVDTYDEFFKKNYKEYAEIYDRGSRDGCFGETSRNTGFKKACAKEIRNSNRKNCSLVIKGRADDLEWKTEKHGKTRIWDWW